MKLVTIRESHNSNDLIILKSKLESEGIHCNMKDQYTSQVLTHIPSMSVKLQVYESDLEKVKEVMKQLDETINIITDVHCPGCDSSNLQLILNMRGRIGIFLNYVKSQLFFSQTNTIKPRSLECMNCGNVFKG